VHGGSFTGRGGTDAYGIDNADAILTADAVAVLAEGASNGSVALRTYSSATVRNSSFTADANGNDIAEGILVVGDTLSATGITVMAKEGTVDNYGLVVNGGGAAVSQSSIVALTYTVYASWSFTISLFHSHLTGGAVGGAGTTTCTAVSRGTSFLATGCP
jgi:hypothetical protein